MFRVLGCIFFQGGFRAPHQDMSGKKVVLTGASVGGIGFETASSLAGRGAQLYLGCRDAKRGQEAVEKLSSLHPDGPTPQLFEVDTSDLDSVRAFRKAVEDSAGDRIDVLVSNAGVCSGEYRKNEQGVEFTFATSALGHHLLARELKPRRVVWVTGDIYCVSSGKADPYLKVGGDEAYKQSCLARIMLSRELVKRKDEIGASDMEVIAIHPGIIATRLMREAPDCVQRFLRKILLTPEQGAQACIYAASCPSSDIPTDTIYFHNKRGWTVLDRNDLAMDEKECADLYNRCETLCGF